MGQWLAGAKDWAISRERYWGTPLPVWESEYDGERLVVGSVAELRKWVKRNGNRYFVMRHGESENNVQNLLDSTNEKRWPLTERGREQAKAGAAKLANASITTIYASPFERTKEAAEIAARELGISEKDIVFDERLRELNVGTFHGHAYTEFINRRTGLAYDELIEGGESHQDAKTRFGDFLYELERTRAGERILIITHGIGHEALRAVSAAASANESLRISVDSDAPHGVPLELDFVPLPVNERYELDLHRPYVDDVVLVGERGEELRRVHEVMDVWLDSGAMPFAQDHYPFENQRWVDGPGYPADFISEAIDQTRGWFYTLLAVGVLAGKGAPYRNAISLGHLLDEEGQKMSKSKGNVVDPWEAMERWGADTLRFWMYSVNQPGESKNFDEKTVREAVRTLAWLENSVKFYSLFKRDSDVGWEPHVIDRWMRTRTDAAVLAVTDAMDAYRPFEATRALASFFEDLSQWYVRRIRDRVRAGDAAALATLHETLHTGVRLLAPFAPFLAEALFHELRRTDDPESVHLCDWPTLPNTLRFTPLHTLISLLGGTETVDTTLLDDMTRVRDLASEALMLRQKAGIKVRQPLALLSVPGALALELQQLLAEEVNVKEVRTNEKEVALDTELSPELVQEGDVREFARALADARKEKGLAPKDIVDVMIEERGSPVLEDAELAGTGKIIFVSDDRLPHAAELSFGTVRFDLHAV